MYLGLHSPPLHTLPANYEQHKAGRTLLNNLSMQCLCSVAAKSPVSQDNVANTGKEKKMAQSLEKSDQSLVNPTLLELDG